MKVMMKRGMENMRRRMKINKKKERMVDGDEEADQKRSNTRNMRRTRIRREMQIQQGCARRRTTTSNL